MALKGKRLDFPGWMACAPAASMLILVAVLGHVLAEDAPPRVDSLEMMNHSFESPLTNENTLQEWQFGGAAVPTANNVVLVPGIANRTGLFWHKAPLKTSHFELTFQFKIEGSSELPTGSPGFAFWYVDELPDFRGADQTDWKLFGHKNVFRGVAVFFSQFDRNNQMKSSISVAENDGTKYIDMQSGVPTGDGIYFSPIRNTNEPLVFRFSVGPSAILGQLRLSSSAQWSECFRLPKSRIDPGGHIGFSSTTTSDATTPQQRYDTIAIERLHVFNLDISRPGEDTNVLQGDALKDIRVEELLSDGGHATDLPEVSQELRRLSRILYKHVSEQQPREQSIMRYLSTALSSIDRLSGEMMEVRKQLDTLLGHGKPSEVVHQVNSELQGLRSLFHSHTKHQENLQQSLSTLQQSMGGRPDMREFAQRAGALEETIKHQAATSSWLIFGVIVMIALFAGYMWKRMRDMEKKHFL